MILIKKYDIPYDKFTSDSTNTETQWASGTYSLNDIRWYQKNVYKVIVASTTQVPGAGTDWEVLYATNVWKCFDNIVGTQTEKADTLHLTITEPTELINGIAFFNVSCDTIQVKVTDLTDGIVYDKTINMSTSPDLEADWYSWFFSAFRFIKDVSFIDLPAYFGSGVTIDIILINTGDNATIGECVCGTLTNIGITSYPLKTGIFDYSRKTVTDEGYYVIEQRPFRKIADFSLSLEATDMARVQNILTELRNEPTVFIGDENFETSIIYGFYKNFDILFEVPPMAICNLSVEGLV